MLELIWKNLEKADELFIPGLSIDCVIIGFDGEQLKVLLLKWKGADAWTLPGGFVLKDEDLDTAAKKITYLRTHLKNLFLTQFEIFGRVSRNKLDPKIELDIPNLFKLPARLESWLAQRFITIGYLSLVKIADVNPKPDVFSEECAWFALDEIPTLVFDHQDIIDSALDRLRKQLNFLPVGKNLLPEKFTFPQLQKLYESILRQPLDRGNFQRKILKLDILERLEKLKEGKAHKAPYLYRFNQKKYQQKIEQGIGFL